MGQRNENVEKVRNKDMSELEEEQICIKGRRGKKGREKGVANREVELRRKGTLGREMKGKGTIWDGEDERVRQMEKGVKNDGKMLEGEEKTVRAGNGDWRRGVGVGVAGGRRGWGDFLSRATRSRAEGSGFN